MPGNNSNPQSTNVDIDNNVAFANLLDGQDTSASSSELLMPEVRAENTMCKESHSAEGLGAQGATSDSIINSSNDDVNKIAEDNNDVAAKSITYRLLMRICSLEDFIQEIRRICKGAGLKAETEKIKQAVHAIRLMSDIVHLAPEHKKVAEDIVHSIELERSGLDALNFRVGKLEFNLGNNWAVERSIYFAAFSPEVKFQTALKEDYHRMFYSFFDKVPVPVKKSKGRGLMNSLFGAKVRQNSTNNESDENELPNEHKRFDLLFRQALCFAMDKCCHSQNSFLSDLEYMCDSIKGTDHEVICKLRQDCTTNLQQQLLRQVFHDMDHVIQFVAQQIVERLSIDKEAQIGCVPTSYARLVNEAKAKIHSIALTRMSRKDSIWKSLIEEFFAIVGIASNDEARSPHSALRESVEECAAGLMTHIDSEGKKKFIDNDAVLENVKSALKEIQQEKKNVALQKTKKPILLAMEASSREGARITGLLLEALYTAGWVPPEVSDAYDAAKNALLAIGIEEGSTGHEAAVRNAGDAYNKMLDLIKDWHADFVPDPKEQTALQSRGMHSAQVNDYSGDGAMSLLGEEIMSPAQVPASSSASLLHSQEPNILLNRTSDLCCSDEEKFLQVAATKSPDQVPKEHSGCLQDITARSIGGLEAHTASRVN